MKILFVGYFEDYARFFVDIAATIRRHVAGVDVSHIYLAPSGYLYARSRGVRALTPLSVKLGKRVAPGFAESDLDLRFYVRGCGIRSTAGLVSLAARYQEWIEAHCPRDVDLAVLPGEYRLFEQLIRRHLERAQTRLVYFEQGPERTSVFDPAGVNANCSFATPPAAAPPRGSLGQGVVSAGVPGWRKAVYRLADIGFYLLVALRHGDALDDEEFRRSIAGKMALRLRKPKASVPARPPQNGPHVLLALQVESDVNYSHHLAERWSYAQMLRWLRDHVAGRWPVVVREHPLYRQRYGEELYRQVEAAPDVHLDNDGSLRDQLARSVFVATANSTLGIEALLAGKPVLLFGAAYYQNCHGVVRADEVGTSDELSNRMNALTNDRDGIAAAAREFLATHFLRGHFRDYGEADISEIAGTLMNFVPSHAQNRGSASP